MQTNELLLASGMPRLAVETPRSDPLPSQKGTKMSRIASLPFAPTTSLFSLFSRFMATVDRLLMASARIATRNGDLPYPGL
jgi:hypothetical protein